MTKDVPKRSPVTLDHVKRCATFLFTTLTCVLPAFGQYARHVDFRTEGFMRRKLFSHALIPEITEEPPPHGAEFVFATGAMPDFGNKIAPEEVFEEPKSVKLRAEPDELFTILMTDFDAPSRAAPYNREWLHWLVGNCQPKQHFLGDTVAPFLPINPQRATGFHRYVFYVYKQPNNKVIKFEEKFSNQSEAGRNNFLRRLFLEKYDLGKLYAVNFFLAEWTAPEKRRPYTDPGPCFDADFK